MRHTVIDPLKHTKRPLRSFESRFENPGTSLEKDNLEYPYEEFFESMGSCMFAENIGEGCGFGIFFGFLSGDGKGGYCNHYPQFNALEKAKTPAPSVASLFESEFFRRSWFFTEGESISYLGPEWILDPYPRPAK